MCQSRRVKNIFWAQLQKGLILLNPCKLCTIHLPIDVFSKLLMVLMNITASVGLVILVVKAPT